MFYGAVMKTEKQTETSAKLSDTLSITNRTGAVEELFMSYALLRSLCSFVGSFERVDVTFMMPEGFDSVLAIVFGPRDTRGRLIDDPDFATDALPYSIDELHRVVNWSQEHVTSFFLKRLQDLARMGQTAAPELQRLNSLLAGLQNSTSSALPVGPLVASPRK